MHVLNAHFQVKEAQLKRWHAACPSDMTFWEKPWRRWKMRGGQGLGGAGRAGEAQRVLRAAGTAQRRHGAGYVILQVC